jgi:hypothetical protein
LTALGCAFPNGIVFLGCAWVWVGRCDRWVVWSRYLRTCRVMLDVRIPCPLHHFDILILFGHCSDYFLLDRSTVRWVCTNITVNIITHWEHSGSDSIAPNCLLKVKTNCFTASFLIISHSPIVLGEVDPHAIPSFSVLETKYDHPEQKSVLWRVFERNITLQHGWSKSLPCLEPQKQGSPATSECESGYYSTRLVQVEMVHSGSNYSVAVRC